MKLKELEKRLTKEPDNLGLRVQVAGVLREAGRSIEAVEHYRFVALAYRDQGRAQQAIAVCRSILEIAPEDSACQGLIAMLQNRLTPPPARAPEPVVPPIGSRAVTNSSGPVSVPSVPSLQRPQTARPTTPDARPPVARPTPEERPLSRNTEPLRRSSLVDETPLPKPMPYHVADRTSQPSKVSSNELELPLSEGADTRPGGEERRSETTTTGLAQAASRISRLISSDSRGVPTSEMDLAAELDTRQRARIAPEQLQKINRIPTSPVDTREVPREMPHDASRDTTRDVPPRDLPLEMARDTSRDVPRDRGFIDRLELDDLTTPPPVEEMQTEQVRVLTPIPRGSEDALTPPPMQPLKRGTPSVPPPAKHPIPSVLASASEPAKRPTPSVPSLRAVPPAPPAQRGAPSVPPPQRGAPSVPPPLRGGPSVPPPQRGAPSVPQRGAPSVPPPLRGAPSVPPPQQRRGPSVPPPQRGAPSVTPAQRGSAPPTQTSTTLRGLAPVRLTPTSLPPPPTSSGSPSRPQLVVAIPPKGESSGRTASRPSIQTISSRGPKSYPPSDEELTQPRDRQGADDDD